MNIKKLLLTLIFIFSLSSVCNAKPGLSLMKTNEVLNSGPFDIIFVKKDDSIYLKNLATNNIDMIFSHPDEKLEKNQERWFAIQRFKQDNKIFWIITNWTFTMGVRGFSNINNLWIVSDKDDKMQLYLSLEDIYPDGIGEITIFQIWAVISKKNIENILWIMPYPRSGPKFSCKNEYFIRYDDKADKLVIVRPSDFLYDIILVDEMHIEYYLKTDKGYKEAEGDQIDEAWK